MVYVMIKNLKVSVKEAKQIYKELQELFEQEIEIEKMTEEEIMKEIEENTKQAWTQIRNEAKEKAKNNPFIKVVENEGI